MHHSLAPYPIGIAIDGDALKLKELQDLRQLLTCKLNNLNVSVLPSSAQWTTTQCDARGIPYMIYLDETTLQNAICSLRRRDTSLKVST